jgi:hypothetical protein
VSRIIISFVSLSPYLQYFGEDCKALVFMLGAGMNLVPILVSTKARFGTLFLSDIALIMSFLSDDGAVDEGLQHIPDTETNMLYNNKTILRMKHNLNIHFTYCVSIFFLSFFI